MQDETVKFKTDAGHDVEATRLFDGEPDAFGSVKVSYIVLLNGEPTSDPDLEYQAQEAFNIGDVMGRTRSAKDMFFSERAEDLYRSLDEIYGQDFLTFTE